MKATMLTVAILFSSLCSLTASAQRGTAHPATQSEIDALNAQAVNGPHAGEGCSVEFTDNGNGSVFFVHVQQGDRHASFARMVGESISVDAVNGIYIQHDVNAQSVLYLSKQGDRTAVRIDYTRPEGDHVNAACVVRLPARN